MAKKSYWQETYYPQPTEAELKENAAYTVQKASRKGQKLNPVVLTGRAISQSWWGQAWCEEQNQKLGGRTALYYLEHFGDK